MFFDLLAHAFAFDIGWFISLFSDNLIWVFMFAALSFIFFGGNKPIRAFLHVAIAGVLMLELVQFVGWQEYTGSFLMIYYVADLSFLKMAESTKFFSNKLVWVEEAVFFGSLILFNVVMRGF